MSIYDDGFHFWDDHIGECHVCKRGKLLMRTAMDVNHKGQLVKVVVLRTNNRDGRRGLTSVQYTCCDNWQCELFTDVGHRRVDDAETIWKKMRAFVYRSRNQGKKRRRRHSKRKGR